MGMRECVCVCVCVRVRVSTPEVCMYFLQYERSEIPSQHSFSQSHTNTLTCTQIAQCPGTVRVALCLQGTSSHSTASYE